MNSPTPMTEQAAAASPPRLPLFSLAKDAAYRTDPAALEKYYADRRLMFRNIITIGVATIGWNIALQIVTPLIAVRLLDMGVRENVQGTITSINFWAVSFLVMLFGWMSDHTLSRFGRRKPYLFIAAPFIIAVIAVFPFFESPGHVPLLLTLQVVYLLFMDLKNSTFALVMIDCVPGKVLARASAVVTVVAGLISFLANRYAADLLAYGDKAPLLLSAGVMLLTTLTAAFVKEPPVAHPRSAPFRPWSTFRIAANFDKRIFVLMAGIALLFAFPSVCTQWLWFWSKETLGFTRQDIFQAVSWAGLANVAMSYPIGWTVDRFGGMRVVVATMLLCIATFVLMLYTQSKLQLAVLVVMQTITLPMYWSVDMLVFKTCPTHCVGAITSTNSCLRNAFIGCLSLVTGWAIYFCNHDYRVGFGIGIALTMLGCVVCAVHQMLMKPSRAAVEAAIVADTNISAVRPVLATSH